MASYGQPAPPNPHDAGVAPHGAARPPLTPERRGQLCTYGAIILGFLSFVWGFLDWLGSDSSGVSGYLLDGSACVALTLTAGLLAGASVIEHSKLSLATPAVASAGLLLAFAVMINAGSQDGTSIKVGLILQLITAIAQVALLVYAWMAVNGRLHAYRTPHATQPAQGQWGPHQPQYAPAPQQPYDPMPPPGAPQPTQTTVVPNWPQPGQSPYQPPASG